MPINLFHQVFEEIVVAGQIQILLGHAQPELLILPHLVLHRQDPVHNFSGGPFGGFVDPKYIVNVNQNLIIVLNQAEIQLLRPLSFIDIDGQHHMLPCFF